MPTIAWFYGIAIQMMVEPLRDPSYFACAFVEAARRPDRTGSISTRSICIWGCATPDL
jgi:hypothetical protein